MKTHRFVIGICWAIFGAVIFSLLCMRFDAQHLDLWMMGFPISLLFIASGFVMMAALSRFYWLCLPCAAFSLFCIPVGTLISLYYLWYYFFLEKRARYSAS